jgi:TDG/mug DNA glycosylase family protein
VPQDPPPKDWKPTRKQLDAARGRRLVDVIGPGLDVLFVGINPSLYSAAVGHHFARPGNRFWPALHRAGFTDRQLSPFEDHLLLEFGCGVSNIIPEATATAAEIPPDAYGRAAARLLKKLGEHRPRFVAILGVGAFEAAFQRKKTRMGPQDEPLGPSVLWILPNPSGLNANYQLPALIDLFSELREASGATGSRRRSAAGNR